MNSPKVSIIIPVYNGSNYLSNAIECAINQTYDNLEVIVVDDGSTDDGKTEKIALSYGDKIRYFRKTNGGVASALNYGIRHMTGQYFSWLSHDDAYTTTKVADSVALLQRYDAIEKKVVAITDGYFIDTHGNKLHNFAHFFESNRIYSGDDVVDVMLSKGTLNGCCMLIPRGAFEDVGIFHESLRYSQDSLMWYKIFLSGYSLVCDNLPNVMYRLHQNQTSQLRRDLYEHDALVIAKLLAEPLAKRGNDGDLLYRYIKRLTKYEATEAIRYLCGYARENGYMGLWRQLVILLYSIFGFFRCQIAQVLKKVMLAFRR
jgi:glycosyltransferase involved in cell wall biosynthesis